MSAIRFQRVSKSRGTARRSVAVLHDVSFAIDGGELVLLVGPSGSGKTTLLGVAAGLLRADAGQVEIGGVRIDQSSPPARLALRATTIGVIFQPPSPPGGLTAREKRQPMAAVAEMVIT